MKNFFLRYEPYVSSSAKNKGIARSTPASVKIDAKWKYRRDSANRVKYFFIQAYDSRDAIRQLQTLVDPTDRRPIAGVSYCKPIK